MTMANKPKVRQVIGRDNSDTIGLMVTFTKPKIAPKNRYDKMMSPVVSPAPLPLIPGTSQDAAPSARALRMMASKILTSIIFS